LAREEAAMWVPDHVFREDWRTTAVHWSCIVLAFQTKARTGARGSGTNIEIVIVGLKRRD